MYREKLKLVLVFILTIVISIGIVPLDVVASEEEDLLAQQRNAARAEELNKPIEHEKPVKPDVWKTGESTDEYCDEMTSQPYDHFAVIYDLPDTPINVILKKHKFFSELSSDDAEFLLADFACSSDTLIKLEQAGFTLVQSVFYARMVSEYGMDVELIILAYPEAKNIFFLTSAADYLRRSASENISRELLVELADYVLRGNRVESIIHAYVIGAVLDIRFAELLSAEEMHTTGSHTDALTDEELSGYQEQCDHWEVNPYPIIEYCLANSIVLSDVITMVESGGRIEEQFKELTSVNIEKNGDSQPDSMFTIMRRAILWYLSLLSKLSQL